MKHKSPPTDTYLAISSLFGPLADIYAKQKVDELKTKKGGHLFEPENSCLEKEKKVFLSECDKYFSSEETLYQKAYQIVKEKLVLLSPLEQKRVKTEMANNANLDTVFLEKLQNKDIVGMVNASETNFSKETHLWLYGIGCELFQTKHYNDAKAIFFFLTKLDGLYPDYWIGLGLSKRNLHEKEEALNSFAIASILDPEHPTARYNSAELYLEMNEPDDALLEYEVLAEIIEKKKLLELKPSLEALKNRISFTKT